MLCCTDNRISNVARWIVVPCLSLSLSRVYIDFFPGYYVKLHNREI